MTDGTVVALSLAGGASVLTGYAFIAMTGVGSKLYAYFTPPEKKVFLTLTVLSIASYFYLFYWAGFGGFLENWKRDLYIASLATYLFGASLWSIQIYNIVKHKKHPSGQNLALLITALGAIGSLVAVSATSNEDTLVYSFAMIAAILLVIQHAFFDLCYWSNVVHTKKKKSKRQSAYHNSKI